MGLNRQRGQASIELVAVLPFVLLVAAVVWQLVLLGHTAWLTAHAARAGARGDAGGGEREAAAPRGRPRRRGPRVTGSGGAGRPPPAARCRCPCSADSRCGGCQPAACVSRFGCRSC